MGEEGLHSVCEQHFTCIPLRHSRGMLSQVPLSVALPNCLTDSHGFSLVGSGHYIHRKGQSNSNLSIESQKGLPLAQAFERCSKQSELVLIDAFWVPSRVLAVRSSTKPSNRSKRRDQPCCVAWPGWIRNNGEGVETKRDLLKGMH